MMIGQPKHVNAEAKEPRRVVVVARPRRTRTSSSVPRTQSLTLAPLAPHTDPRPRPVAPLPPPAAAPHRAHPRGRGRPRAVVRAERARAARRGASALPQGARAHHGAPRVRAARARRRRRGDDDGRGGDERARGGGAERGGGALIARHQKEQEGHLVVVQGRRRCRRAAAHAAAHLVAPRPVAAPAHGARAQRGHPPRAGAPGRAKAAGAHERHDVGRGTARREGRRVAKVCVALSLPPSLPLVSSLPPRPRADACTTLQGTCTCSSPTSRPPRRAPRHRTAPATPWSCDAPSRPPSSSLSSRLHSRRRRLSLLSPSVQRPCSHRHLELCRARAS